MMNDSDRRIANHWAGTMKPAYQKPLLAELDVESTHAGIITGAPPENITYIS